VVLWPGQLLSPSDSDFVWNIFDLVVVSLGLFDFISTLLFVSSSNINVATVFRIVRILRILRVLKLVRFLKQLYVLAYGFAEAAQAIFWVTVLMTCILYMCAIVLVRTIGRPDVSVPDKDFWTDRYGTILQSMLTLFELMSSPSLVEYQGKLERCPALACFLVIFIITGSFGMIALLTGVISESMFEKNQIRAEEERLEHEARRINMSGRLSELFDKAGFPEEGAPVREIQMLLPFVTALFESENIPFLKDDLQKVTSMMDMNCSGWITKYHFMSCMMSITEKVRPMTIMEISLAMHYVKNTIDGLASLPPGWRESHWRRAWLASGASSQLRRQAVEKARDLCTSHPQRSARFWILHPER